MQYGFEDGTIIPDLFLLDGKPADEYLLLSPNDQVGQLQDKLDEYYKIFFFVITFGILPNFISIPHKQIHI